MSGRRVLTVIVRSDLEAEVSGRGASRLLEATNSRRPVYSAVRKAFVVRAKTAHAMLALAQEERFLVDYADLRTAMLPVGDVG